MKKIMTVLGLVLLAGCAAGGYVNLSEMQHYHFISYDKSDSPDYDYKVRLDSMRDSLIGWDLNRLPDRMKVVHALLKDQPCSDLKLVSEDKMLLHHSSRWNQYRYYMHIKCIK